jgi:uncharacterized membrane protein (UPF0127 family)
VRLRLACLGALCVVAIAPSCGGDDRTTLRIQTRTGVVELSVELAESTEERRRGLMGRTSLASDAGMVFVYGEPRRGGLWMKNTLIPLSAAFLDREGRVLRILDMEPCRADPCRVYDPGVGWVTAVEVNRGAFERLGVAVGDVATLER